MSQEFAAGDFLIFQLESGYGLMRVLAFDDDDERVWHVSIYTDLFLDPDFADVAVSRGDRFGVGNAHVALTDRAFNSTQVAKIGHRALTEDELVELRNWRSGPERPISDRSVRLLMGLR